MARITVVNQTTLDDLVSSHPELLIVDLRISGDDMKGWDVLMLARLDELLCDVPLIVCSAEETFAEETFREREEEFRRVGGIIRSPVRAASARSVGALRHASRPAAAVRVPPCPIDRSKRGAQPPDASGCPICRPHPGRARPASRNQAPAPPPA